MSIPIRVLIQSRTTSTRLPGKAFLPLGGIPLAVLTAKRAARNGLDTVLATSTDPSDDALAEMALANRITVFRGSLDNVIERFLEACADLPDNAVIVRLTGDNPVPDADFIDELIDVFNAVDEDYVGTTSPDDALPYGLSAEVVRLALLRDSATQATLTPLDKENVTSWVRNHHPIKLFDRYAHGPNFGHIRATIDTLEDYLRMKQVFDQHSDPVTAKWPDIKDTLVLQNGPSIGYIPWRYIEGERHSEMVLGTAQIGMAYGVANSIGMPCENSARKIIHTAIEHGVTHIDTARDYKASEARLGVALSDGWAPRVHTITKLDHLPELTEDSSDAQIHRAVDESIYHSCRDLRQNTLQTVLVHVPAHIYGYGGRIWQRLLKLRNEGTIKRLGISVRTPEEALNAVKNQDVKLIQLPVNILDWRWQECEFPELTTKRADLIVHGRSVLLQGILTTDNNNIWPKIVGLSPSNIHNKLLDLSSQFSRKSILDLCFAYVRSMDWVDGVVVGVETPEQCQENLELFTSPYLEPNQIEQIHSQLPRVPEQLLNPMLW
ncbi:MAG: aldo/keto reductase [Rhodospirillales bacterium]|nr:aldo/keto reductase [Rhodospirillales bacterium]